MTDTAWDDAVKYFWARVRRGAPNECWEWTGPTDSSYGMVLKYGMRLKAHRMSYEIHNGPFLSFYFVLHRCDNKLCVNPKHLYLGDYQWNATDRTSRRRGPRSSGLSEQDVLDIREAYSTGAMSQVALGRKYGITQASISYICAKKSWRQV